MRSVASFFGVALVVLVGMLLFKRVSEPVAPPVPVPVPVPALAAPPVRAGVMNACIPGASIACACADGRSGAQVCQPDGTFAPCACAAPPAPAAPAPPKMRAVTFRITGAPGFSRWHLETAQGSREETHAGIPFATEPLSLPVGSAYEFRARWGHFAEGLGGAAGVAGGLGAAVGNAAESAANLVLSAVEINCEVIAGGEVVHRAKSRGVGSVAVCRGTIPDGTDEPPPSEEKRPGETSAGEVTYADPHLPPPRNACERRCREESQTVASCGVGPSAEDLRECEDSVRNDYRECIARGCAK